MMKTKKSVKTPLIILAIVIVGVIGYFILVEPIATQPSISRTPESEEDGISGTTFPPSTKNTVVLPSLAIQGYKQQNGPAAVAGEFDVSEDCKIGVLTGNDEGYCAVSQANEGWERGVGVAEIYFEVPPDINTNSIRGATIDFNLICSSGLGLYYLNDLGQWVRFGRDLPSQAYKPDGSYGYLSCSTGVAERKSISLPIEIHDSQAGIQIVKEEATAFALIDEAVLNVVYSAIQ